MSILAACFAICKMKEIRGTWKIIKAFYLNQGQMNLK
jgi:hypothetical protein